jgi:hypothetical protein
MSGPEGGEGGGEGGGEQHGFLSEAWEQRIEGLLGHDTNASAVLGGVDAANRASGMAQVAGNPGLAKLFFEGSHLAEEGHGLLGAGAKAMPFIGSALGGVTALGNGVLAANDIAKEGWDNGHGGGAYHDQTFYNHAGGTALGAAHAVLPWLGPYGAAADLALTGGEMAANYGGKAAGWAFGDKAKFNAESVAGGLIRGTFGDQSAGEQVRQGVGNVFGHGGVANAVGWGADIATNAALLPMQLGSTVGRGIYNEGSAIVNSIANGEGAVGGALNHAGHAVADGARSAWNWAGNTANTVGHGISNAASTVGHGLSNAASWAGNTASNIGSGIANTASNIGSGIANTASNVGHGISNAASSVGNAASSAFHAVTSW